MSTDSDWEILTASLISHKHCSSRGPQHLSISTAKACWREPQVPKRPQDYDDDGIHAFPTWVSQEGQKSLSVWGVLEVFHCTFLVAWVSWFWPSGSRLNPEVQCHRLSLEQDEREAAFYCGTPKQQKLFKSQTKDSHGTPVGHAYIYPPIRYSNSE